MRLLALILMVSAASALAWQPMRPLPHRFGVVEPGRLYRSGSVSRAELSYLQQQYGIRRVVSLLDPTAPESRAERAAAEELGVTWENVPLAGNGDSQPV